MDIKGRLFNLLVEKYPNMSVGKASSGSIYLHPPKQGFPQINISLYEERIEWQGYWGEITWSTWADYAFPTRWGRACDKIVFKYNSDTERRLLALTEDWFKAHPPEIKYVSSPPVGYTIVDHHD